MKEKYTTPEMEIIEFEVEDIVTASSPSGWEASANETGLLKPVQPAGF